MKKIKKYLKNLLQFNLNYYVYRIIHYNILITKMF